MRMVASLWSWRGRRCWWRSDRVSFDRIVGASLLPSDIDALGARAGLGPTAVNSGMVDFDDYSLVRGPERQLAPPTRSGPPVPLIIAFALLVLSAGALWYALSRPKTSAAETVPAV